MCLAVPAEVVEVLEGEQALVDVGGAKTTISLSLVDGVSAGDYVLVRAGFEWWPATPRLWNAGRRTASSSIPPVSESFPKAATSASPARDQVLLFQAALI